MVDSKLPFNSKSDQNRWLKLAGLKSKSSTIQFRTPNCISLPPTPLIKNVFPLHQVIPQGFTPTSQYLPHNLLNNQIFSIIHSPWWNTFIMLVDSISSLQGKLNIINGIKKLIILWLGSLKIYFDLSCQWLTYLFCNWYHK